MNTYPIYDYRHFRDRLGTASLRYKNRAKITVLMCELKPYPIWFWCRRKSFPVECERNLRIQRRNVGIDCLSPYAVLKEAQFSLIAHLA